MNAVSLTIFNPIETEETDEVCESAVVEVVTVEDGIRDLCNRLNEATEPEYTFTPDKGGRAYVRIVQNYFPFPDAEPHKSAHCFVKKSDGSIWKPAGWKGPARNFPRGNVYCLPKTVGPYFGR